ncbi:MAG: low affinity iron permease family protein [Thermoplasmatota archaeon]|nr:low affinity iron permease family protein [Halobacteriales archaeon]
MRRGGTDRKPGLFSRFAKASARATGHALAFSAACLVVVGWLLVGPVFHFSDTWQLTINTATTIITTLMVFIIQNTQLRDAEALQIKVDALILNTKGAHNDLMGLEELPEGELRVIQQEYAALGRRYRHHLAKTKKPRK